MAAARRIGILAGGGTLPREIADIAAARGCEVHIVALEGEADGDFSGLPVTRVNWGQIGGMLEAFKAAGSEDLVIVGRARRPDLLRLRTDLGFFLSLPAIIKIVASGGDDGVLRGVVGFFEGHGLRVIGPSEAAPELLIGKGHLGHVMVSDLDASDIETGFALVRALGAFDVGQSVIVSAGRVEAIEGAEGTDRMLARIAAERQAASARGRGVLVKRTKPGQDLRVDMPAIGPETATRVAEARLNGIAVEARRVLLAGRAETIQRADGADIFIAGCVDRAGDQSVWAGGPLPSFSLERLGWVGPRAHHRRDVAWGAGVVAALGDFNAGQAAAVVRRHVLAVEAGEGAAAMLERASRLKQWGRATARRRSGAVVLADTRELNRDLVQKVASTGYGGVAVMGGNLRGERVRNAIEVADHAGLFVVACHAEGWDE